MTLNEIMPAVKLLTKDEREALMQHLREIKDADERIASSERIHEHYERYKAILEDLMDCKVDLDSRRVNQIKIKLCLAYRLYMDGFSEQTIGACMKKHHSTINAYKGEMEEIITHPYYDSQLADVWTKFNAICSR